jgi:polysaccharide chain length determinant protein (PEP-CTERM system associated)
MTTHAMTGAMPERTGASSATRILAAARRRRALAILPFAFVLVIAAALAAFLPSVWTGRAVVLVDSQQTPEALVKAQVPAERERQVLSLSQQILSRPRLAEIAATHGLMRGRETPDEAAERMRREIRVEPIGDQPGYAQPPGLVAFTVQYQALEPGLAMVVTNELARLFVLENEKVRERQAATTSEFLETQLADVRERLAAQEKKIAEYKERHMGELPEQRDANMRTLERLNQQLQFAQENLRRANERKSTLARTLAEIESAAPATVGAPSPSSDIDPAKLAAARLSLLRQELAAVEAQAGPNDPRVARLRADVERQQQVAARTPPPPPPAPGQPARPRRLTPDNPYVVSLMTQLDSANVESRALTQDIAAIQSQIAVYQRRLENTPRTERELAQLSQDHDALREMLKSLMARRGEARIAADFEHQRKGETFRVIESAAMPKQPTGPNRLRVLLMGLVLGVGASALAVVVVEHLDSSYKTPDELRASLAVPLVAAIPSIRTVRDRRRARRRRTLATAAAAMSLVLVAGAASVAAKKFTPLASLFTPAAARR